MSETTKLEFTDTPDGAVPAAAYKGGFPARPDLARLPAYVEPPRVTSKVEKSVGRSSTIIVLLAALGAGMSGGLALRVYNPFRTSPGPALEAAMPTMSTPYVPPPMQRVDAIEDIPLPSAVKLLPEGRPAATRAHAHN